MTFRISGRLARRALAAVALTCGATLLLAAPAASAVFGPAAPAQPAQSAPDCGPDDEEGYVKALKVDGRLDAVLTDFVASEVASLETTCTIGLLLQLNSSGMSNGADLDGLVEAIDAADEPVEVWVGPSGSRATNEAAQLLEVADRVGLAEPEARIEVTDGLLAARGLGAEDLDTLRVGESVRSEQALELGLVDSAAPTISEFAAEMEIVETEVITDDGEEIEAPVTPVISAELPLLGQLMHTVASSSVAYILLVIGLALLMFEFFSAGVGIAGMVGAGSLVLAGYGLASLPTNPVGLALIAFAMFGYAIDAQTGVPRAWTGIATILFIGGSLWLYDGTSLSWITLMISFVGVTIFMLRGMPVMVRSRFSTPVVDRGWLTGEQGTALTPIGVGESGSVTLRDAPWVARVSGEVPIAAGADVEVVGADGYTLEVEVASDPTTNGNRA